jgi:hypothetical protein
MLRPAPKAVGERENREEIEMKLEVVCYAGMKADERPVRFRLDGHEYLVEDILDQVVRPREGRPSTKSVQTMGTFISSAERRR